MENPWIVTCPNCKKDHEAAEEIHCDCGVYGGKGRGWVGSRMGFIWHWQPAAEQTRVPDLSKAGEKSARKRVRKSKVIRPAKGR